MENHCSKDLFRISSSSLEYSAPAFPREVQGRGRKRDWEKRDTNKERLRYKKRRKRGWKRRESRGWNMRGWYWNKK